MDWALLLGLVLLVGGWRKRLRLHVPVAAVVMLESGVASCVHCEEDV